MAGLSRKAIFVRLRRQGCRAAAALHSADEIRSERAAQIRRAGRKEAVAGVLFSIGALVAILLNAPFLPHRGVMVVAALAGAVMILSGLGKIRMSDDDYTRAIAPDAREPAVDDADYAAAGLLAQMIPPARACALVLVFVALTLAIGCWLIWID